MRLKTALTSIAVLLVSIVPARVLAADATALVFWAEWCGACKILDPVLDQAVAIYDNGDIDIVRLDYTSLDYESVLRETAKAERLGVADKVSVTDVRTGYALIVVDGEFRGRISAGMTAEMIHDAFDMAIQY